MKKKKSNWIAAAILSGMGIIAIFIADGNLRLTVREYTILSSSVKNKITLVALTDLHGRTIGKNQERLAKKVAEQNPDVIVYLGDMIDKADEKNTQALICGRRPGVGFVRNTHGGLIRLPFKGGSCIIQV